MLFHSQLLCLLFAWTTTWAHVGDSLVVLGDGDGGGDESLNETDGWLPNC